MMAADCDGATNADFKSKDTVEVSVYLSDAGVSSDICEIFEGKLKLSLCGE